MPAAGIGGRLPEERAPCQGAEAIATVTGKKGRENERRNRRRKRADGLPV